MLQIITTDRAILPFKGSLNLLIPEGFRAGELQDLFSLAVSISKSGFSVTIIASTNAHSGLSVLPRVFFEAADLVVAVKDDGSWFISKNVEGPTGPSVLTYPALDRFLMEQFMTPGSADPVRIVSKDGIADKMKDEVMVRGRVVPGSVRDCHASVELNSSLTLRVHLNELLPPQLQPYTGWEVEE